MQNIVVPPWDISLFCRSCKPRHQMRSETLGCRSLHHILRTTSVRNLPVAGRLTLHGHPVHYHLLPNLLLVHMQSLLRPRSAPVLLFWSCQQNDGSRAQFSRSGSRCLGCFFPTQKCRNPPYSLDSCRNKRRYQNLPAADPGVCILHGTCELWRSRRRTPTSSTWPTYVTNTMHIRAENMHVWSFECRVRTSSARIPSSISNSSSKDGMPFFWKWKWSFGFSMEIIGFSLEWPAGPNTKVQNCGFWIQQKPKLKTVWWQASTIFLFFQVWFDVHEGMRTQFQVRIVAHTS